MNPDRLAELEEERKFLLRSIRDIEAEHAAGDVDERDYLTLRDGYVARAAAVLREIEDGRSSLVPKRPQPWWRRAAILGGTLVVALAMGLFVAHSAGQRLPGQSLTGGQPADEVAVQLATARQSMGTDPKASLEAYAKVLVIQPDNVEAITYAAWLKILVGQKAGDQSIIKAALPELRHAEQLDPTYADAHCFLAVASGSGKFLQPSDPAVGVQEGNLCLGSNPPAMLRGEIEQMIAELQLGSPTTT